MPSIMLLFIAGLGTLLGLFFSEAAVTFQSLESVNAEYAPVFNEVKFIPGKNQDIWLMHQTQNGYNDNKHRWDQVAIVVDKTFTPKKAVFYQLDSGPLQFDEKAAIPLKARCYACHANGPRVIRMELNSPVRPNLWQRATVALWNLRIKTYGQVVSVAGSGFSNGKAFTSPEEMFQQPLNLKSCTLCHSEKGLRQPLRTEHLGTASFLVRKGLMPPWPFRVSKEDSEILQRLTSR